MNKKRIIPIIISASALSMLTVGCLNTLNSSQAIVFNSKKVVNIEKARDDKSYDKSRFTYTENKEAIQPFNNINLVSFDGSFDENKLEYNISLTLKNVSKKPIEDLNMKFVVIGPDSTFSTEDMNLASIEANSEFKQNITLSKNDLLMLANNSSNETDSEAKRIISNLLKDEYLSLKYTYNYKHNEENDFNIEHELDLDGNTINEAMHSTVIIDKSLETSHKDNGSYLNLVKPEDKYDNNIIETQSVEVKIDKDFNFEIVAKFKNISDKNIERFRFEPHIILGDALAPDSLNSNITVRESIKAGEEFEISTVYNKDIIKNCIEYVNSDILKSSLYKNEDKALRYLVENRFISLNYKYDYETKDISNSIDVTTSRSGKLDIMSIYEYSM